ncbi:N-acetylmuramoyl-L-alanine amidase [bacterium]|nr:N-acetylmuramoyl-L-alanine amidase [bacterium]MBP9807561.1 N-acetylmuramoyl-L-alanine amidase [bacterium]
MFDSLKLIGLEKAAGTKFVASLLPVLLALTSLVFLPGEVEARKHSSASSSYSSRSSASKGRSVKSTKSARASSARSSRSGRVSSRGSRSSRVVASSRSSSRARGGRRGHAVAHSSKHHHAVAHAAPKPRYAYPIGLFMRNAPSFDTSPLDAQNANAIASAFDSGSADAYAARVLVRAGVVKYHPLHGGIFWRREPVKYIVMHSTETGIPVSATRVIDSWSSMGIRHPGAQYVVDRDGTIYQAVDPDLATVHVNIFKTLPGINNDNSIGIEINHTGSQNYPQAQLHAVTRLVGYLQSRYNVDNQSIITHRYAQQGDHTDPVNFDWDGFIASKNSFRNQAIAYRSNKIKAEAKRWKHEAEVPVNTYMKPHTQLSQPASLPSDIAAPITTVNTTVNTTTVNTNKVEPAFSPASVTPRYVPANAGSSSGTNSGSGSGSSSSSGASYGSGSGTRSFRINPATIPPPGSLPVPGQVIESPVPEPSQADPASRNTKSSGGNSSAPAGASGAPIPSRSQSLPPDGALGTPGSAPLPGEDI